MARLLRLTFGPGTDDNKSEIRRGAARTELIFVNGRDQLRRSRIERSQSKLPSAAMKAATYVRAAALSTLFTPATSAPGCTIPICCKIILARREASNSTGRVIN